MVPPSLPLRMPAADQVVSVPEARRPPGPRGHPQPLVDAEHGPLGGAGHRAGRHHADRENRRGDPAAQHRPGAHRLHAHPRGRGSVTGGEPDCARSKETIAKRKCNRLLKHREAYGRREKHTRWAVIADRRPVVLWF